MSSKFGWSAIWGNCYTTLPSFGRSLQEWSTPLISLKMLILVFLLILQCNSLFFYFNALWDDNHVFLKIFRNGKQREKSDFSRPEKDKVSRKEIKKIRTHVRPINNSDEWKTWFRYFLYTHIYLVLLTYLEILACL